MSKELFHYIDTYNHDRYMYQETWEKNSYLYLKESFKKDIISYISGSKQKKIDNKNIINNILDMITYFPFIENKYIAEYINIFISGFVFSSRIKNTYAFPPNTPIENYNSVVDTLKIHFPNIFIKLLHSFILLSKIKIDESKEKEYFNYFNYYNLKKMFENINYLNTNIFNPKLIPKILYKYLALQQNNYLSSDEKNENEIILLNNNDKKLIINLWTTYSRQMHFIKVIKILINQDYHSSKMEDVYLLQRITDFNIFLDLLCDFFIYYTDITKIYICGNINCLKLFYLPNNYTKYCSNNCCNNMSQRLQYTRKKRKIYTSKRSYYLEE